MIGHFLSNTNESATVLILQKNLELNKALAVHAVPLIALQSTPSSRHNHKALTIELSYKIGHGHAPPAGDMARRWRTARRPLALPMQTQVQCGGRRRVRVQCSVYSALLCPAA